MAGSMLFHVSVSEGRNFGGIFPPPIRDTYDVHADVHLRQTLRLRSIMVGYAGPKSSSDPSPLFLDPPSFPADLLNTAKSTLLMYPVQNKADCSNAGFVTCDRPLDDAPGCSPNWNALIAKLIAQKSADGNRSDVIYYGLLPTDIPFRGGSFDIGCERSGMSVGRVPGHASTNLDIFGGSVMAHLVGHECGLLHTPPLATWARWTRTTPHTRLTIRLVRQEGRSVNTARRPPIISIYLKILETSWAEFPVGFPCITMGV